MPDFIHEYSHEVLDEDGTPFTARAYAEPADKHLWNGWIEFTDPQGRTLRTGRETTQSRRELVEYWASGLEPVYLEGALERARALVSR